MKKTFTFPELLLVAVCAAGIVALTVAAAGAGHAKTAACADTMRILEQKFSAWENDHDGRLLPSRVKSSVLWGRILLDGGYFEDTGHWGRGIRVYPKNFECPAETRQRNNGKVDVSHPSVNVAATYDYALNWYAHQPVAKLDQPSALRKDIHHPERLMRMIDGTLFRMLKEGDHFTARHGAGAANVLFSDGHVAFLEKVPFKGVPGYNGRFWFNTK